MSNAAADIAPPEWTDDEWRANLHQIFNVLGVVRGMKGPDIADALPMPRSTFYDKLKKGSFTALELRHAAKALDVPASVFYEPVDDLFTGPLGRHQNWKILTSLPEPTGQGSFDDLVIPPDFRPALTSVI